MRLTKKIAVAMGGVSPEREISLCSGKNISDALKRRGYDVFDFDLTTTDEANIISALKEHSIESVFIALHGEFGEDGRFQEILEKHKIPFTGSGSTASLLALDKIASHHLFRNTGLPVLDFWVLDENAEKYSFREDDFPLIVKPHLGGSSLGISVVFDLQGIPPAIEQARKVSSKVLVEKFIQAREFTIGILGTTALPPIEIVPKNNFFDYTCKYGDHMTEYILPAALEEHQIQQLKALALRSHHALGCRHFSRVDLLMDKKNNSYILELNSIPGFTSHSLLPLAAQHEGIAFDALCEQIAMMATL